MKQARAYARMFINTVGASEKALEELALINELNNSSMEFANVLVNPVFSRQERDQAVGVVCDHIKCSEITRKFIIYIAEEGAAGMLGEIFERAIALYRQMKGKVKATVLSSIEIDKASFKRLKKALEGLSGRTVELEAELDAGIIGGMLVKVGSRMFDASIQGQLRQLKEELIKG